MFYPVTSTSFFSAFNRHPGCDCENGYEGDHCEFREGENSPRVQPSKSSWGHKVFAAFLIIVYVCSLVMLILMVRRWRVRTLAERHIVEQANYVTSELTMRCMREKWNDADTVPLAPGQESKELNESVSDLL